VKIVEKGWLDKPEQIADLYCSADLVLMPSELESFGLMAAEAMSCGRVVVALEVSSSALPETINSPTCGLAVSRSEYPGAVLDLLCSSDELLEREKKSLEFAQSEYSNATYLSRILHVYSQAVADFPSSDSGKFLIEQLRKASNDYWKGKNVIAEMPGVSEKEISVLKAEISIQKFSSFNKVFSFYAQHGLMATARKVRAVISRRFFRG
jgi:hypothetical protein